jgi:hypothetical protein
MLENLLDHLFVPNKSEDSHLTLALGTGQGINLIYFLTFYLSTHEASAIKCKCGTKVELGFMKNDIVISGELLTL